MIRSMYSGVSGIRAHQIKMDTIGNNISNVNTQGFKASRAAFANMFNQTLRGATAPSGAAGGSNPLQIGLGVSTASVDVIHTTGSTMTTDRTMDLAIQGEGFFNVMQGNSLYFTRAGNLYLDESGYMVTSNGQYLQGIMLLEDWGDMQDFDPNIPTDYTLASTSDTLPATGKDFFNLGSADSGEGENFEVPSKSIRVPLDFSSISIGKDGTITGIAPNGELMDIAIIPMAVFTNAPGLNLVGDNLYELSSNSGELMLYQPGQGGVAGDLRSGALEMSNVDLSREFTEMIVTQRGYQANSRIITVSDTLLEELINLKR